MPSRYGSSDVSLDPRQPSAVLLPVAGLLAGPLNPTALASYAYWSRYFYMDGLTSSTWIMFQVIPMSVAVAIALYYLRAGGFGILTIIMTLFVALICAASGWAITVAGADWLLYEQGVQFTNYPVGSLGDFTLVAGTGVRLNLLLNIASLIPAAVIIRLIAFRRGK